MRSLKIRVVFGVSESITKRTTRYKEKIYIASFLLFYFNILEGPMQKASLGTYRKSQDFSGSVGRFFEL